MLFALNLEVVTCLSISYMIWSKVYFLVRSCNCSTSCFPGDRLPRSVQTCLLRRNRSWNKERGK